MCGQEHTNTWVCDRKREQRWNFPAEGLQKAAALFSHSPLVGTRASTSSRGGARDVRPRDMESLRFKRLRHRLERTPEKHLMCTTYSVLRLRTEKSKTDVLNVQTRKIKFKSQVLTVEK